MNDHYIGIDIGKASLEVYIPRGSVSCSFDNTRQGIRQLYGKLKKIYRKEFSDLIFIFEHTGSYSHLLASVCSEKETKAYIVRPSMSANFAKAVGNRNKTDKADAHMLYRMYATLSERPAKVPSIDQTAVSFRSMMGYYKHLQKERVRAQNYLDSVKCKNVEGPIAGRLEKKVRQLRKEEEEILALLREFIQKEPEYAEHVRNFQTVKGIGEVASLALLNIFLTYPETSKGELTALMGLDPVVRESGTSVRKKSRISKQGNRLYRSLLFMPAMMACNYNDEMKAFYQRLKENGKHTTQAQLAVMRKLILLAHALYKNKCPYDPEKHRKKHAVKEIV